MKKVFKAATQDILSPERRGPSSPLPTQSGTGEAYEGKHTRSSASSAKYVERILHETHDDSSEECDTAGRRGVAARRLSHV